MLMFVSENPLKKRDETDTLKDADLNSQHVPHF